MARLTGILLPNDWCVQPKDSSGKEKEVHLVELDPTSNSTEYNRVADEIRKTIIIIITLLTCQAKSSRGDSPLLIGDT